MAEKINFGAPVTPAVPPTPTPSTEPTDPASTASVVATSTSSSAVTNNANVAVPTIVDQTARLVVFVGPAASGKSMLLVRLAQYLRNQGYTITCDTTFLNTEDYRRGCDQFQSKLNTNVALDGTVEFLLVNVYDHYGKLAAKLLEAPGEDFYSSDKGPKEPMKAYLATIMTNPNPKTFIVLTDLHSKHSFAADNRARNEYAERFLTKFYPNIKSGRDKIILLYNKIDLTQWGDINSCKSPQLALNDARMYYPSWFSKMKIKKWVFFEVDNFVFLTFCTGMYSDTTDDFGNNIQVYNPASDTYPAELWSEITKRW